MDDREAERLRRIAHLYLKPRGECADNHLGEPCGRETVYCRKWTPPTYEIGQPAPPYEPPPKTHSGPGGNAEDHAGA